MNQLLLNLYRKTTNSNLTLSRWKIIEKTFLSTAPKIIHNDKLLTKEEKLLKKHESAILYSDYLVRNQLSRGCYGKTAAAHEKFAKEEKQVQRDEQCEPLPVSLRYLGYAPITTKEEPEVETDNPQIHFPYKETNAAVETLQPNNDLAVIASSSADDANLEIKTRLEMLNKSKDHLQWMNDYENFPHVQDNVADSVNTINYGTSNPKIPTSNVPCGGCGALLHCKDTAIPGYIPSEIFKSYKSPGGIKLEGIHCQRCHFLKHYNMALQVRVSSGDYPKVLQTISQQKSALVILLVDLLDFPCSIWPGIADLIGQGRPIFIVGNKVDLLPDDGKGYLRRVHDNLVNATREAGLAMTNIKHVALISAKTGFGVEDLITRMHALWEYKGDVYIVGCTNVGKSSLFNILLQSDYCKHTAVDLIQRATTSPWPGTTLNLLKFPILRPSGWRLYARNKRLQSTKRLELQEKELRQKLYKKTRNPKYASLIGHIERTFTTEEPVDDENTDIYAVRMNEKGGGQVPVGINMKDKRFALSKWCFDTPGVVQPEQIIHHFTTDELIKVFPKSVIKPRTYSLQPGSSIFIAGIARLDYVEGCASCRFTVFASYALPVTICKSKHADDIYKELLLTDALAVPMCNEERLRMWPGLESSKYFIVTGIDRNTSSADLVLSSAGWVAVTPNAGANCTIQGWTPERRGIYLRDCLLPNIVRKRGRKSRDSCAYKVQ